MTLTGAQIDRMLEEQFCGLNSPANGFLKVLLPSAGFPYTWARVRRRRYHLRTPPTRPPGRGHDQRGSARPRSELPRDREQLPRGRRRRLRRPQGRTPNRLGGAVDTDAFEAYLDAAEPTGISPAPRDRIDVQP